MKRLLVRFCVLAALGLLESLLARQLPLPLVVPLVIPAVLALAASAHISAYRQMSILAALIKEVGSGLPFGATFISTVTVLTIFRVVRRRKERLVWWMEGIFGTLAMLVLLSVGYILTARTLFAPVEHLGLVLPFRIVLPSLLAGLLIAGLSRYRSKNSSAISQNALPLVPPAGDSRV